ncbi:MAG TPA: hypothetical protein VII12_12290 [Thermoanaerobaculia bacterium]
MRQLCKHAMNAPAITLLRDNAVQRHVMTLKIDAGRSQMTRQAVLTAINSNKQRTRLQGAEVTRDLPYGRGRKSEISKENCPVRLHRNIQ